MYEKFYGLDESPFNLTPDSRFLFLSSHHREALAALLYGVRERKGFTLLTGEIGSGKTTLCRAMIHELEEAGTKVALIVDSYVNEVELLEAINQELGIGGSATGRRALVDSLNRHLVEEHMLGRNVAVIIDEAQNLSDSSLEQVRLLGNLETETEKLVQIVLIGQPELQTILQGPKLEQLNQRIAVRYHLAPLDPDEVDPYIQHRLRVAGASAPIDFTPAAIKLIYEFTGGVPRKINLLCDRALLAGYVASSHTIDEAIIRSAAMEVGADQWAATRGAVTGHPARAGREPSRPFSARLLYILIGIVVLAMIPVVLSETGLLRRWFGEPSGGQTEPRKSPSPTPGALAIPPTPTPAPEIVATPTPTPPAADAATTAFRLARPKPAAPWTYDEEMVVRVDRPEFCKTAAILTLLAAWGIEVNLEDFRNLSVEEAAKLDLVAANRDIGLRSVEVKGGLNRVVVYDVPVVVELNDPEKRLSNVVTLLEVRSGFCRVADPMMGIQKVPRRLLESFWKSARVIYFDPDNLGGLTPGQRSESVRSLQQALARQGFYHGAPTGEFDRATARAIEFLQRFFELYPTGRLDPLTVMLIATHGEPDRPHLVPQKELER